MFKMLSSVMLFALAATAVHAQSVPQRLKDVKTVYVGSFGEGEGPSVIRSKVVTYLVKSRQLSVVEDSAQADAILLGSAQQESYLNGSLEAHDHATAGVRLVGRDQRILWVDDVSNGIFASGHSTILPNASTSLADRIVKRLLKAIAADAKASGITKN